MDLEHFEKVILEREALRGELNALREQSGLASPNQIKDYEAQITGLREQLTSEHESNRMALEGFKDWARQVQEEFEAFAATVKQLDTVAGVVDLSAIRMYAHKFKQVGDVLSEVVQNMEHSHE